MSMPVTVHFYRFFMTALTVFLPLYLRRRVAAGKEDETRITERFAIIPQIPKADKRFWLHAVSVGECRAALRLSQALTQQFETCQIIISCGTVTAAELIAQQKDELPVTQIYAPFDAPKYCRQFFDNLQPDCGIILESDFWPNIIMTAHEKGIPLFLASAQMSENAFQNWRKRPQFAKAVFGNIAHIFATDETQKQQFDLLGAPSSSISGTLKLPQKQASDNKLIKAIKSAAGTDFILLAASTHETEEALALSISRRLTASGLAHFLIIAPRHPDRADSVAALCPDAKRRSYGDVPDAGDTLYLADRLGDMTSLYEACDIVLLGATFIGKGGHNPLEAAAAGKPIICGPSQFKNQLEFHQMHEKGVCFTLSDEGQIVKKITSLMANEAQRKTISRTAKKHVIEADKRADKVAARLADILDEASS